MKFAICNEIYYYGGWSLEKAFKHAADVGYNAIEIAPFTIASYVTDISKSQRDEIRKIAARAGIEISGIHWVLAQTEGFHITHPDRLIRERTSKYCVELVKFCADIGGKFIVLGSPKQRSLLQGVSKEQGIKWACECLKPAIDIAQELKITICIEPLGPNETNFINTATEAIDFIRYCSSFALKIMLDVKAMASEGRPIPEIIKASWPHFAYFHANDVNLKGPGFGHTDFRPIAQALKQVGYDGYISVEIFIFDESPEVVAYKSLQYLKTVF
ncbi:MAG: sugar phosphate isomerase/epimerase family protein [candidate division WOR-3 bacterium]